MYVVTGQHVGLYRPYHLGYIKLTKLFSLKYAAIQYFHKKQEYIGLFSDSF